MEERQVHVIWCDDIRLEVGNKPSFMGVYIGGLTVPSLPVVIPKLVLYVWLSTPLDKPFKQIKIRIVRDDKSEIFTVDLGAPEILNLPSRKDLSRSVVMASLSIIGLNIPEHCKYLAVFVDTESGTLEGAKLHIDVAQEITSVAQDQMQQSLNP